MEDGQLLTRQLVSLRRFVRDFALCSDGGHVVEHEGLCASVQPAAGGHSLFNSVTYEDVGSLAAALPALAAHYEERGVSAWTVWVHESDAEAVALLREAGHRQDSQPMGMGLDLADLPDQADDGLDIDREPSVADLQAVISAAYGFPAPLTAAAFTRVPPGHRAYLARHHGTPAASLLVGTDGDGDTMVEIVGVVPEARGKGLSRRLLHQALLDERRDHGAVTSTLRSSAMGHPVYALMGYRDLGRMFMYERRAPV